MEATQWFEAGDHYSVSPISSHSKMVMQVAVDGGVLVEEMHSIGYCAESFQVVNSGDWVVVDENGMASTFSPDEFKRVFEEFKP